MTKHTQNEIQDPDPADGMKAVGCLFAGIIIIGGLIYLLGNFIHQLR